MEGGLIPATFTYPLRRLAKSGPLAFLKSESGSSGDFEPDRSDALALISANGLELLPPKGLEVVSPGGLGLDSTGVCKFFFFGLGKSSKVWAMPPANTKIAFPIG